MVGDSITVRSKPALTTAFNAQGITSVVIDAEVSRRIEIGNGKQEPLNGEQVMTNLLKVGVDPDVWVVALGTNDVGSYDQAGYAALIDAMLAKLPPSKPLVWIDVFRPSDMSDTVLFNQVLRDRAARRPHTLVASWFDVASKSPKKLLTSDNLHPSDAGTLAFADVVGSAVALAR